ncbi:class I SAM-dependent methyltransferase [Uliginosibacterium aquaticum]|uniref:Class I SAM-dependent methyltransferase n=1 Tax=Uliginosibacterium aquaticum TaxID=2731212 RepID=A0ABX2IHB5_9RHOO|nr:class I SAM-dependent methyltransferase [Uliginosibacterium aquaticum]NSL53756.1 class I SAM-dependent methyltransferase [Uliginosibacterium aquaticum]
MSYKSDLNEALPVFSGVAHAEKYQSGNWIANRLVINFLKGIVGAVSEAGNKDVHEIGCGEGHILGVLASAGYSVRGCDISQSSIEVARQESVRHGFSIQIEERSIYDLDEKTDAADTIVCCEVLEHLTDPALALKKLLSVTRRDLILSVPNEPVWHLLNMVRGKYWNALGNTPGHFQHWTSGQFLAFVSEHADIVSVKKPLPWTLIHCRPRSPRQ